MRGGSGRPTTAYGDCPSLPLSGGLSLSATDFAPGIACSAVVEARRRNSRSARCARDSVVGGTIDEADEDAAGVGSPGATFWMRTTLEIMSPVATSSTNASAISPTSSALRKRLCLRPLVDDAARILERVVGRIDRCMHRGHEPHRDADEDRDAERERDDDRVERELARARNEFVADMREQRQRDRREHEPEHAARERQREAFGEELRDDAAALSRRARSGCRLPCAAARSARAGGWRRSRTRSAARMRPRQTACRRSGADCRRGHPAGPQSLPSTLHRSSSRSPARTPTR